MNPTVESDMNRVDLIEDTRVLDQIIEELLPELDQLVLENDLALY